MWSILYILKWSKLYIFKLTFILFGKYIKYNYILCVLFDNWGVNFATYKRAVCVLKETFQHYSQQFTEIEKTTQSPYIKGLSGFESLCRVVKSMFWLTFRELWSTTSCFKTVFFTFFSTRVTSNESCSF